MEPHAEGELTPRHMGELVERATLRRAVDAAIGSAQAAADYFRRLAARDQRLAPRPICLRFAEQAQRRAARLAALARRLTSDDLATSLHRNAELPRAPSWSCPEDANNVEVLAIGRDHAYKSAFFYDLIADAFPRQTEPFRELAGCEEELAHRLESILRSRRIGDFTP